MLSSYNWNIAIGLRGVRLETTNDHHLRLSKDAARGIALAARKNKLLWDWPYLQALAKMTTLVVQCLPQSIGTTGWTTRIDRRVRHRLP